MPEILAAALCVTLINRTPLLRIVFVIDIGYILITSMTHHVDIHQFLEHNYSTSDWDKGLCNRSCGQALILQPLLLVLLLLNESQT